jgi:hypothetical protein
MTLIIMTIGLTIFITTLKNATLSIWTFWNAPCLLLFWLSIIMLAVVMLNVVELIVVAP